MMTNRTRAWTVLILAIGQIATTFWPLTGIGEYVQARSDAFPTPLVPIGWTFAIWGVIYLGATAYAIWQFLPRNRDHRVNRHVGWLIAYMYLVNTTWQVWVSIWGFGAIDFLALASEAAVGTLVLIRLNQIGSIGWRPTVLAVWPVALLTGWTTAASFVGSTVSASAMDMAWATDANIGLIILYAAIVFATILTLVHRRWVYAAAVTWASWGLHNNAIAKGGLEDIQQTSLIGLWIVAAAGTAVFAWNVFASRRA